ncbi:hypothetical protein Dxin01_02446 [Deinococcus xinjiangensis]|uniref:Cas12f1-like TNB domain-containing protein n=1 Tax=Deinococcus xinjiangensis TaxID=457454 RepID=A0ABP9VG72_9DEIO
MSNSLSRRNEPDRYDTLVRRSSYPAVQKLIAGGTLRPVVRPSNEKDDPIKGVRAVATYTLTPGTMIQAADPHHLMINDKAVEADLYKLPSHAYIGLVSASPRFVDLPGVTKALEIVRKGETPPQQVKAFLEQVAHQSLQIDLVPRLVKSTQQFTAFWQPGQTLIHRTAKGDFFVTLQFKVQFRALFQATHREPIAVDVGLHPLTTALHQSGNQRQFCTTSLTLPDHRNLTLAARRLYDRLIYSSGRQDCEQVVAYLVQRASVVIAEHLRLNDMDRGYIEKSRARAIQDHHFAALSQYLNAARIPLDREDSGYTSIECPKCRHVDRANRKGRTFECRKCGHTEDAHLVACRNLLHRWQRTQRRVA